MELITLIILRSVERIIGLVIGGLLAWLGYRLFLDVPLKQDNSGKFILPGGTAIRLTRVGPGVFFSLFGTAIVFMSFIRPANLHQELIANRTGNESLAQIEQGTTNASTVAQSKSDYSAALTASMPAASTLKDLRNLRRGEFIALNRVVSQLRPDLDSSSRSDLKVAVPEIKLALMENLWDKDWGDFTQFVAWANSGETNAPKSLQAAADYFNSK